MNGDEDAAAEPVGAQFGRDLEPNGLNLEGLAIVGGVKIFF